MYRIVTKRGGGEVSGGVSRFIHFDNTLLGLM